MEFDRSLRPDASPFAKATEVKPRRSRRVRYSAWLDNLTPISQLDSQTTVAEKSKKQIPIFQQEQTEITEIKSSVPSVSSCLKTWAVFLSNHDAPAEFPATPWSGGMR